MNKWIPLDGYHKKPKKNEIVILTDGKNIYHDMVWLDEFKHDGKLVKQGWYWINASEPMNTTPTHWLILELPK